LPIIDSLIFAFLPTMYKQQATLPSSFDNSHERDNDYSESACYPTSGHHERDQFVIHDQNSADFEPRPLAPPESLRLITDPVVISMLQMGCLPSTALQLDAVCSLLLPPQRSQSGIDCAHTLHPGCKRESTTLVGSVLDSILLNHQNSIESSHAEISTKIPGSSLPAERKRSSDLGIKRYSPYRDGSITPMTLDGLYDCVQRSLQSAPLPSLPSGVWSLGSLRRKLLSTKKRSCSPSTANDASDHWMDRYKEMLDFYRDRGHSHVPSIFPDNQSLANWVKRTRRQYKLFQQGRHSSLTGERVDLLDRVHLQTDIREISWQEQYQKLLSFKDTNGHTRVKPRDDKALSNWIKRQRQHCRDYSKGGHIYFMTAQRYQQLIDSGIVK
jgi:hypothetical protein